MMSHWRRSGATQIRACTIRSLASTVAVAIAMTGLMAGAATAIADASPVRPDTPATPKSDGPKAPESSGPIHAIVVKDLDGNDVSLSKFAGTPMVIEIWATWCGPCVKQRTLMMKLAPEFKDKVVFIGASVDQEGAAKVKQHISTRPSCPELHDFMATPALRQLVATRVKGNTIPKVVYVDSRGNIADAGASVQTEAWMRAMLKNLR